MAFSEQVVQKVGEKSSVVSGNDPQVWRKDQCEVWMGRSQYGKRNSQYGWEIDHIKPVSEGGGDELSNLRPLQWENNASKQSGRLGCAVSSTGKDNARRVA